MGTYYTNYIKINLTEKNKKTEEKLYEDIENKLITFLKDTDEAQSFSEEYTVEDRVVELLKKDKDTIYGLSPNYYGFAISINLKYSELDIYQSKLSKTFGTSYKATILSIEQMDNDSLNRDKRLWEEVEELRVLKNKHIEELELKTLLLKHSERKVFMLENDIDQEKIMLDNKINEKLFNLLLKDYENEYTTKNKNRYDSDYIRFDKYVKSYLKEEENC